MKKSVFKSRIDGEVKAPSSKSYFQRLIALSLLTEEETVIPEPEFCSDVAAAVRAAGLFGADVKQSKTLKIRGARVSGLRDVTSGESSQEITEINCGESGLAIRMFSPVAALLGNKYLMTGSGSLLQRPVNMITDALSALGVHAKSNNGFPPVEIKGPLRGGEAEIDGSVSSQVLTGLLVSLPLADSNTVLKVNGLKSRPYVDMTIQLVEKFGGRIINSRYSRFEIKGGQRYLSPGAVKVEGDWSGAAFVLVAALVSGGSARVNNLRADSAQADRAIINVLRQTGAAVECGADYVEVKSVKPLLPFETDASDCPDLFPPLAALASACSGVSRIHGTGRLRHKESDREKTLLTEFMKAGIRIESGGGTMKIEGGRILPFTGNSHNDHRVAMAIACAALRADGETVIENAEAVNKSYPGFYDDLAELGGAVL